jgi:hypothetical protein
MAEVLREYFDRVHASDVFDYGAGYEVASFVGGGVDVLEAPAAGIDWVITNPPFNLALDFALRGLELAREGVALLVRTVWLEGRRTIPEPVRQASAGDRGAIRGTSTDDEGTLGS